jgi:hypothetical protein
VTLPSDEFFRRRRPCKFPPSSSFNLSTIRSSRDVNILCLLLLACLKPTPDFTGGTEKWAGRDLDSRPFGYQPNALTMLSYRPPCISALPIRDCIVIIISVFQQSRPENNYFSFMFSWHGGIVWLFLDTLSLRIG